MASRRNPPNTSATIVGGWGGASIGRRVSRCCDTPPLPPFSTSEPHPRPQKFTRLVDPPCLPLRGLSGKLPKKFPDADLSTTCHLAPIGRLGQGPPKRTWAAIPWNQPFHAPSPRSGYLAVFFSQRSPVCGSTMNRRRDREYPAPSPRRTTCAASIAGRNLPARQCPSGNSGCWIA